MMILTIVSGCEIFTPEKNEVMGPKDSLTVEQWCYMFRPIYFSREDTVETQEAVVDYLIVLNSVCGGMHNGNMVR